MPEFVWFLCLAFLMAWVDAWLIKPALPNRWLILCASCGSKLWLRPKTKKGQFVDTYILFLVAWAVLFRLRLPELPNFALLMVLIFAEQSAKDRLMARYFLWRHPVRCQGGGHLSPAPQGT